MSGQHIGYVRVSSVDQNTDRQLDDVTLHRVFEDKASGKDTDRPALKECLDYIREGDTLHIHSMDRLARNLEDLRRIVRQLNEKGVVVHFHHPELIFSGEINPFAQLMMDMLGAVAEFERALISERQREGIAKAKQKGVYTGRKPSLTPEQAVDLLLRAQAGEKKTALAEAFGISRESVYTYLRQARTGQPSPTHDGTNTSP